MVTLVIFRSNFPCFLDLEQIRGLRGLLVYLMVDLSHLVESMVMNDGMYMDI